jgi:hypothetical protein
MAGPHWGIFLAKLAGVGLTALIFEATKGKLLQMVWFRRVYDYFIWLRAWANREVDPIKRRLCEWRHVLWHFHSGRFAVRLLRLRRRMGLAGGVLSRGNVNRIGAGTVSARSASTTPRCSA